MTSETLDFESEQVFESHEHLQSTADIIPVLKCFYMDQIALKQPIFKIETRNIGLLYIFENTHHYQCIHKIIWAYTSDKMGQMDHNWVN